LEIAHNPLLAILPTLARIYETQKIYEQAYERIDDRIKWDGVKARQPDRIWSVRSQLTSITFQQTLYSDPSLTVNHIPQILYPKSMLSSKFAGRGLHPVNACMT
jgi:hypothetical protein